MASTTFSADRRDVVDITSTATSAINIDTQDAAAALRQRAARSGPSKQASPSHVRTTTTTATTTKRRTQTRGDAMSQRVGWVGLALASGACAAFNGVFAKLTTTQLTTTWATAVVDVLGLEKWESYMEIIIRATFFALNLLFNGIMWALFTRALTRGSSTTRVAILNTAANFVLTALAGAAVFAERLPPLWWVGAGLLVAGCVVVGAREGGEWSAEARERAAVEGSGSMESDGEENARGDRGAAGMAMELDASGGEVPLGKTRFRDEDVADVTMDEPLVQLEDDEDTKVRDGHQSATSSRS